jgi:hypothetical protein
MALLRDQPISQFQDWIANDSKLAVLAAQESISVETKAGIARDELRTQLLAFLIRYSGLQGIAAHSLLEQVAITEPLARWHVNLTLALYYNDLASLQNNEALREQSRYYDFRADSAREQLCDVGVGIVNRPIAKAAVPDVSVYASGADLRVLRARTQLVAWDGSAGAASDEFVIDMSEGKQYTLMLAENSPELQGWRLFVGESSGDLVLAQEALFPFNAPVIFGPQLPETDKALSLDGQSPDRYIRNAREARR